ncbi:MAG: site-specific DNA-methyltransferase [Methanobrevibacter sp.]|nr:site-specific DNA-methyltransferase [Methanobrevibacter sp.]MBQ9024939.1 site-specific DNA-methyltransferase [Methanobrevibacter sp.]
MVKLESPGVVEPRLYKPVIGDDKPFNPQHLLDLNVPSIIFGANNFAHELPNNHRWLVWFKKPSLDFKRNNFSDVELCWTNLKGKSCLMYHHSWSGMVREGDRKVELTERVHPTQKPVGLLEQMILEFTNPGDVVLDPYGGGGSTLIACERTGRTCLIMELSEDYCEIIENRYWNYMGKGQVKLM